MEILISRSVRAALPSSPWSSIHGVGETRRKIICCMSHKWKEAALSDVYIMVPSTIISQQSLFLLLTLLPTPQSLFYIGLISKECPRAKTKSSGGSLWCPGHNLPPAYSLMLSVNKEIKRRYFPHLLFSSFPTFSLRKIELLFSPCNYIANMFCWSMF